MMFELPEGFLDEEMREGFLVSSDMKKVWAGELKSLSIAAEIAKRHGIKWIMAYGSLIGAVRHKGFIPWDDDIDIIVPRHDFRRFIKFLTEELPENYRVYDNEFGLDLDSPNATVTNRMHPDIGLPGDKEITEEFFGSPYVLGFDIFPFDRRPPDDEYDLWADLYCAVYDLAYNTKKYKEEGTFDEWLKKIEELTGQNILRDGNVKRQLWQLAGRIGMMYDDDESLPWCRMMSVKDLYPKANNCFDPKLFDELIEIEFENIKVPAPKGYDRFLTEIFGPGYMTPVKSWGGHEYPFYAAQERKRQEYFKKNGGTS